MDNIRKFLGWPGAFRIFLSSIWIVVKAVLWLRDFYQFQVKKRQQRVLMILDSKHVKYDVIDITEPGREADKDFMQNNAKSNGGTVSDPNPRSPLPPQMFNDDEYCGVCIIRLRHFLFTLQIKLNWNTMETMTYFLLYGYVIAATLFLLFAFL